MATVTGFHGFHGQASLTKCDPTKPALEPHSHLNISDSPESHTPFPVGCGSKLSTPKMDGFPTKHDHFCGSLVP